MSQETLFQESQALYAAYFFAADGECPVADWRDSPHSGLA